MRSASAAASACAFAIDDVHARSRDRRPRSTTRPDTRAAGRTRARCGRWRGGASRPGTSRRARRTAAVRARIARGQLQHAICQSALLGGDSAHAPVVRGEHGRGVDRGRGPLYLEQPARAVDRGSGGEGRRRRARKRPAAVKMTSAVSAHGTNRFGRGNRDVGAGPATARRSAAVSTIGSGRAWPTGLLEDEHEIDEAQPEPAGRLRCEQADDAHLHELRPEARDPSGLVRPRVAHVRGGALLREEIARPHRGARADHRRTRSACVTSSAGRGHVRRSRCVGSRWCRRRSAPRARTRSPSSTPRARRRATRRAGRAAPAQGRGARCRAPTRTP